MYSSLDLDLLVQAVVLLLSKEQVTPVAKGMSLLPYSPWANNDANTSSITTCSDPVRLSSHRATDSEAQAPDSLGGLQSMPSTKIQGAFSSSSRSLTSSCLLVVDHGRGDSVMAGDPPVPRAQDGELDANMMCVRRKPELAR